MKRWTDPASELDPRAAAAARLLARVTPPAPWSAERRARVAAALRAAPAPSARWIWVRRAAVGALAAIAVFALVPRTERAQRVRRAEPAIAAAPAPAPSLSAPPVPPPAAPPTPVAVAPAPAVASEPARPRSRTVTLPAGQLVVDGRDERVVVETPRARIEVPPGGRARVVVGPDGVRVATLKQAVIVHWIASDARIEVAAGEIWSSELLGPPPAPAPVAAPVAPAPPASPLGDEARLFAQILEARRTDPAGQAVLALLDEYTRRYPDGTFAREAQMLRVDVLVRAGNGPAALAVLDGMPLDRVARGVELRIVRGELRMRAQRPREAIEDFDHAIPQAVGTLAERARYGRAMALAQVGDAGAARAALADYLAQFPVGRFAAAARAALKKP